MEMMPGALLPPINYPFSQALHDLTQIAPIVAVAVALLVAMIVDLILPPSRRGVAVAVISVCGLLAALVLGLVLWASGSGHSGNTSAYYGYMAGDDFALFFEVLLSILGVLAILVSHVYLHRRDFLEAELHILTLAAVIGMMALAAATSLVTVFLGLEALSIALYVACGYARTDTSSQEAAVKYLLVGGFASAFVLYGMALVYGASGSTLLSVIASRVGAADATNPLIILGVLLMGVGFGFKVSGAPFHQWTPDVYQGAPLPVTAFMSVGTKAAAFAMIMRVYGSALPHVALEWQVVLAFVSVCSMVWGNLAAIAQTSVKRLLAYSGVAQAGYVLVGIVAGGRQGFGAALYYLMAYLFMNFGAFAVLTLLARREGEYDSLSDLDGLGYRSPLMGVLMSLFMFALAGFPFPPIGFFGKFFLFSAGIAAGWTWLVVIAVLASVVSVAYYVRIVYHVWLPATEPGEIRGSSAVTFAVVASGVLATLIGILPGLVFGAGLLGAASIAPPGT
jgi:NADH-quinone oxidoreductase subunit N